MQNTNILQIMSWFFQFSTFYFLHSTYSFLIPYLLPLASKYKTASKQCVLRRF